MPQCKICALDEDQQNELNKMIAEGYSYSEVARHCTNAGYTVSDSAVQRHYTNHVLFPENSIEFNSMEIDPPKDITTMEEEQHLLQAYVVRVCLTKMKKYMEGRTPVYPEKEIRSLKVLNDICGKNFKERMIIDQAATNES